MANPLHKLLLGYSAVLTTLLAGVVITQARAVTAPGKACG